MKKKWEMKRKWEVKEEVGWGRGSGMGKRKWEVKEEAKAMPLRYLYKKKSKMSWSVIRVGQDPITFKSSRTPLLVTNKRSEDVAIEAHKMRHSWVHFP